MIIVLGATGTIGQLLVTQLKKASQDFVIIARNIDAAKQQFNSQSIRFADLDKPNTLIPAFKGGSALFLLSGHGQNMEAQQLAAIDAAKQAGIQHIVKISGCEASISPSSSTETGREHYRIEQHLKNSTSHFVILRCNFFMQNLLDQAASMVRKNGKILMPFHKNTPFSFIDAQDIAHCAAVALTQKAHLGKTYYLTGQPSSFMALSNSLSTKLNKKVTYKKIPLWLTKLVMRLKGGEPRIIRHQMEMAKLFLKGAGKKDTNKVLELTRVQPSTLNEFIDKNIAHFQ